MQGQLVAAAAALRWPPGALAQRLRRLHFATVPVSRIPGWLPGLLADWQREQRVAIFSLTPAGAAPGAAAALTSGRLDSWYGWLPTPSLPGPTPLAYAGADCGWLPAGAAAGAALRGKVAVVQLSALPATQLGAPCSYLRLLKGAADAGAAALLMVAPPGPGSYAAPANCTGGGPPSPLNGWVGAPAVRACIPPAAALRLRGRVPPGADCPPASLPPARLQPDRVRRRRRPLL